MKKILSVIVIAIVLVSLLLSFNVFPVSAASQGTDDNESLNIVKDSVLRVKGNYVECRYTVTNTGSHRLTDILIEDSYDQGDNPPVKIAVKQISKLATGESVTVTSRYTPTDYETERGYVSSTVSVTATDYQGNIITAGYGGQISDSNKGDFTNVSIPTPPVPELPAGVLFGLGLAGVAGLVMVLRKRSKTSNRV